MLRKLIVAFASTVAIGSAVLTATDASARGMGGGGFRGGSMRGGGGVRSGGMRVGTGVRLGGGMHNRGGMLQPRSPQWVRSGRPTVIQTVTLRRPPIWDRPPPVIHTRSNPIPWSYDDDRSTRPPVIYTRSNPDPWVYASADPIHLPRVISDFAPPMPRVERDPSQPPPPPRVERDPSQPPPPPYVKAGTPPPFVSNGCANPPVTHVSQPKPPIHQPGPPPISHVNIHQPKSPPTPHINVYEPKSPPTPHINVYEPASSTVIQVHQQKPPVSEPQHEPVPQLDMCKRAASTPHVNVYEPEPLRVTHVDQGKPPVRKPVAPPIPHINIYEPIPSPGPHVNVYDPASESIPHINVFNPTPPTAISVQPKLPVAQPSAPITSPVDKCEQSRASAHTNRSHREFAYNMSAPSATPPATDELSDVFNKIKAKNPTASDVDIDAATVRIMKKRREAALSALPAGTLPPYDELTDVIQKIKAKNLTASEVDVDAAAIKILKKRREAAVVQASAESPEPPPAADQFTAIRSVVNIITRVAEDAIKDAKKQTITLDEWENKSADLIDRNIKKHPQIDPSKISDAVLKKMNEHFKVAAPTKRIVPEPITPEQRAAWKAASDADHAETNRIRKEQAEREADEANPHREKYRPSGITEQEFKEINERSLRGR
jgi:hypothetical protein